MSGVVLTPKERIELGVDCPTCKRPLHDEDCERENIGKDGHCQCGRDLAVHPMVTEAEWDRFFRGQPW